MAVRHLLLLAAVLLMVSSAVYALSEEAQFGTAPKATTIQQKKVAAAGIHVGKDGKKYQTDHEGFPILSFPRDEVTKQVMADIAKERAEEAAKAKEKAEASSDASADSSFVESEMEEPSTADDLKAEAAEKAAELADAKAEALDAKESAADADAALKDAAGYVDPVPTAPIQAIGATPTPDTKPVAPAPAPTPAPTPAPAEPKPAPTPAPAPAEKPKPKRKWFKPVIIAGAVDHTSQQPEPVLPPVVAAPAPCLKGASLLEMSAQYRQVAHLDAEADAEADAESEADGEDASEGASDADASASSDADASSGSDAATDADADADAEESEPITAESDPKLIFSRRRHKRAPVPEPDRGQFPVEHEDAKQFVDLYALENKGMWETQKPTIENVKGINVGFHNPRTEAQAWAFWKRAPDA